MFYFLCLFFVCLLVTGQQLQAPALLLTTYDSISIVYPKEMGYEKDFLQTIYKINEVMSTNEAGNETLSLRIEDAVYDQLHSSVYFIMSVHRVDTRSSLVTNLGCELVKLKQNHHQSHNNIAANHVIALNWSRNLVYKNETVSILSMQMNEKKRKLYWLEYNYFSNKWSVVVMRSLDSTEATVNFDYYTFTRPSIKFSTDGYSFISVVYDTIDDQTLPAKPYTKKLAKKRAELVLFITNNQTLNICFLSNLTCRNFFDPNIEESKDYGEEYYDEYSDTMLDATTTAVTTTTTTEIPPTAQHAVTFGRLMGIQYDHKEHTLYIADYGYDRIEKVLLEVNNEEFTDKIDIKASYIQTLVQSSPGQLPINPIMSVAYDNNIFWTDFEDGLKSTIYKSPCIRPVYQIKNATTLKLIHILAKAPDSSSKNAQINQSGYRLSSISKNQFQYPPDYNHHPSFNSESSNEFEALKSNACRSSVFFFTILVHVHKLLC